MSFDISVDGAHDAASERALFELVCAQLLALSSCDLSSTALSEHTKLVEDLGLDSLKFVDLTVNLEDALGIAELPMQEWIDAELEAGRSLTVGALIAVCRAATSAPSEGA